MSTETYAALYPGFLKLAGRPVVLVGGGTVATAKLGGLLEAGAAVTVVAPSLAPPIVRAAELASLTLRRRPFEPADLDGAWLVVAAATPEVNRAVVAAAEARRVFTIAVDEPSTATAYGAGVLRRGGLTLAVSTEGRSPALAGLVREALESLVPEEIGEWVETARAQRAGWQAARVPHPKRRPLLLEALNRLYAPRQTARSTPAVSVRAVAQADLVLAGAWTEEVTRGAGA